MASSERVGDAIHEDEVSTDFAQVQADMAQLLQIDEREPRNGNGSVERRIKALKKIQLEMTRLDAEYYKEVYVLQTKYNDLYVPLYEKRAIIVSGEYEPTDIECEFELEESISEDTSEDETETVNENKTDTSIDAEGESNTINETKQDNVDEEQEQDKGEKSGIDISENVTEENNIFNIKQGIKEVEFIESAVIEVKKEILEDSVVDDIIDTQNEVEDKVEKKDGEEDKVDMKKDEEDKFDVKKDEKEYKVDRKKNEEEDKVDMKKDEEEDKFDMKKDEKDCRVDMKKNEEEDKVDMKKDEKEYRVDVKKNEEEDKVDMKKDDEEDKFDVKKDEKEYKVVMKKNDEEYKLKEEDFKNEIKMNNEEDNSEIKNVEVKSDAKKDVVEQNQLEENATNKRDDDTDDEISEGACASVCNTPRCVKYVKPNCDVVKGIPDFWLTIFKNVEMLSNMIEDHDEDILKHLIDIKVKFLDLKKGSMGFKLEFYFSSNEYFTNKVLTKEYKISCNPDSSDPFSFEGPSITECTGCHINWNKGKNVTVKVTKKRQKHRSRGAVRTVTKTTLNESFFRFFSPPSKCNDIDDDDDEDTLGVLLNDYEIGHNMCERIIPKAVLYYTGEALDDEIDSISIINDYFDFENEQELELDLRYTNNENPADDNTS